MHCEHDRTHLALSNGVQPSGLILLSITVFKYTVVARSFHGRPRKHLSAVTVVAFASGDYTYITILRLSVGVISVVG